MLEMVHLDGRVGLVRPRVARAIRGAVASIFCVQRDPTMRLCVCKHVCVERCCGFSVVMPLQARVTLEMVHFDGRAVGGAPEGCARCLMCRCEQILNAKSSLDVFVAQKHEGHFCGCVLMHGRATQGSCIAQDGTFDGRAVGGAPGAIFIYGAITNTL